MLGVSEVHSVAYSLLYNFPFFIVNISTFSNHSSCITTTSSFKALAMLLWIYILLFPLNLLNIKMKHRVPFVVLQQIVWGRLRLSLPTNYYLWWSLRSYHFGNQISLLAQIYFTDRKLPNVFTCASIHTGLSIIYGTDGPSGHRSDTTFISIQPFIVKFDGLAYFLTSFQLLILLWLVTKKTTPHSSMACNQNSLCKLCLHKIIY